MKHLFLSIICGALVFSGCNPGSGDENKTAGKDTTVKTITAPVTSPNVVTNPAPIVTPTATPKAPATNVVAAGMNPEHGKPGHRCDIAVGAPLNTPAANPTIVSSNTNTSNINPPAPTINTTPVVQQPANSTPTAVAPGMNPQHGQPGHRCDIPVGSPLSTKPAAPVISTTPGKSN